MAEEIADMFVGRGVVLQSLYDLRPSNVPLKHWLELKPDAKPVYHRTRSMPPKHDKVVYYEIKMLKAGIITPVSSELCLPVVIATKEDWKPRFCVDYLILNRLMEGDRFPIPLILEIFDDLSGAVYYTLLDFIICYWQIRMHEACKVMTTIVRRYGTFQF